MENIGTGQPAGRDLAACLAHLTGYRLVQIEDVMGPELQGKFALAHAMQFLYAHEICAMPWTPKIVNVLDEQSVRTHLDNGGVALLRLASYGDGWCVASDCLLHKPFDPEDPDDLERELPNIQLENVVLIGDFRGEVWE